MSLPTDISGDKRTRQILAIVRAEAENQVQQLRTVRGSSYTQGDIALCRWTGTAAHVGATGACDLVPSVTRDAGAEDLLYWVESALWELHPVMRASDRRLVAESIVERVMAR